MLEIEDSVTVTVASICSYVALYFTSIVNDKKRKKNCIADDVKMQN